MRNVLFISLLLGSSPVVGPAFAQQPAAPPPAYGEQIDIQNAKKAAAAAVAEAKKINTFMAIAVVSPSGDLVYFEKMDNTQFASINISIHKAKAAATFRRPTQSFEERVGAGGVGLTLLTLDGIIASPGGNPIIVGGKLIGAIGVSGGTGAQGRRGSLAGVAAAVKSRSAALEASPPIPAERVQGPQASCQELKRLEADGRADCHAPLADCFRHPSEKAADCRCPLD